MTNRVKVALINENIRSTAAFYAEDIYNKEFLGQMTSEEQQDITLTLTLNCFLRHFYLKLEEKLLVIVQERK